MECTHMCSLLNNVMSIKNIPIRTGIFEDLRCKKMSGQVKKIKLSSNTDLRTHTQGKWLCSVMNI